MNSNEGANHLRHVYDPHFTTSEPSIDQSSRSRGEKMDQYLSSLWWSPLTKMVKLSGYIVKFIGFEKIWTLTVLISTNLMNFFKNIKKSCYSVKIPCTILYLGMSNSYSLPRTYFLLQHVLRVLATRLHKLHTAITQTIITDFLSQVCLIYN